MYDPIDLDTPGRPAFFHSLATRHHRPQPVDDRRSSMRRPTLFLAVLALFSLQFRNTARADETSTAMADAAKRFLAALDDKQKAQASFPFDSPERFNWHWIPRERKGLPIKAMTPEQRALAFGLLDTGLSTNGMLKATTIMSLEEILRVKEHGTGPVRDPELYFVSIFGNPGDECRMGLAHRGPSPRAQLHSSRRPRRFRNPFHVRLQSRNRQRGWQERPAQPGLDRRARQPALAFAER